MTSTSTSESEQEQIRLQKLSSDMLKILKNGSSNDVKIILGDGELMANKDVLAARCDYFAATFRWNDNNKDESGNMDIRINDCNKKVMEHVVEFLFTGVLKFKDLDLHSLMSLIDQIRKLVLGADLEKSVEEFLINDILSLHEPSSREDPALFGVKEQDLIASYLKAYTLNLDKIQYELSWRIALFLNCSENILEAVRQMIVDLPTTLLKDILSCCHYFNRGDNPVPEFSTLNPRKVNARIFQFLASWYKKNKDGCSEADKDEMMQFIQLDKFLMSDLIKIVKPSGLFPDEKVDEMMLAHAEEVDKFFLGLDGEK